MTYSSGFVIIIPDKTTISVVSWHQMDTRLTRFVLDTTTIIIIIFITDSNNIDHTKLVVQSEGCQRSLCPIHTADADGTKLFCCVGDGVGGVNTIATSSRRLPTDSVDNLETDQTDSIAFDYTNFDR